MSLKVLHLHFGKDGGAERFFVNLVNALGERGVEQRFVIRPHRVWKSEIAHLGEIIENNYRRISPTSIWLEWRVRKLARSWQPDAILAWMPRAARLIPATGDAVKFVRLGDFPRHLRHFRYCDFIVGNIPGIGLHCQNLGWDKPVVTISNFPREVSPVPVDRQLLDTPEDAFVISSSGRFVPRKGMDLLVRAVARIPGAFLWLLGEGKELDALKQLAQDEGVADRVRFAGWVDEPIHYVAASDLFCMPSRHEPLGNVVLEAWKAGVPTVSTRSEGPSWYMKDGDNGLLVDIDDLDALVDAINRVRADPGLGSRLVANANRTLDAMFSKERIVDFYIAAFQGHIDEIQAADHR